METKYQYLQILNGRMRDMLGMIHPLVGMAEEGWRVLYCILLFTRASKWSFGETKILPLRLSAVGMLTSLSLNTDRSPFERTSTRHRSSGARFNCNLSAAKVFILSAVLVTAKRKVQYVWSAQYTRKITGRETG